MNGLRVEESFLLCQKLWLEVWLEGLIHKLKTHGISGDLLQLVKSFSSNRKQRVVLNGQYSDWQAINASTP